MLESAHARMMELTRTKGEEYSGSDDQLANFRRLSARTSLTMKQVWLVYFTKHMDAIETFIRDEAAGTQRALSEPIVGRIDDALLYLQLLRAMVVTDVRPVASPVPPGPASRALQPTDRGPGRDGVFELVISDEVVPSNFFEMLVNSGGFFVYAPGKPTISPTLLSNRIRQRTGANVRCSHFSGSDMLYGRDSAVLLTVVDNTDIMPVAYTSMLADRPKSNKSLTVAVIAEKTFRRLVEEAENG